MNTEKIKETCLKVIKYIDLAGEITNGIFVKMNGETHRQIANIIADFKKFPRKETKEIFDSLCTEYWGNKASYMNQPYSGPLYKAPTTNDFFCEPRTLTLKALHGDRL